MVLPSSLSFLRVAFHGAPMALVWSPPLLPGGPLALMPWLVGLGLNSGLAAIALLAPKKLLTPAGLCHAWILGILLWGSLGWRGYLVMLLYFLVGSGVTRIGQAQKEAAGIAEKRSGARGPENVWGSALVAAICALGVLGVESSGFASKFVSGSASSDASSGLGLAMVPLLLLGYVASIATKLSDTSASEVGKAYGQRTFLITTLQPVPRGTEGAVSLEGTVAGALASVAIALLGWAVGLISPLGILLCIVAAFVATNAESVIGATVQTQFQWLTNEIVNILNTLIGAGVAILLGIVLGYGPN